MIIFSQQNKQVVKHEDSNPLAVPKDAIWIDLLNPTAKEEKAVEDFLCVNIPTHEEMHEIEVSNRLYTRQDAYYMTATMVAKVDTTTPETHAVTFVLTDKVLVTVRYMDATSFRRAIENATKLPAGEHDGAVMFLGLLESVVDRIADILERLGRDIDRITREIFRGAQANCPKEEKPNSQKLLERIGRCGDLSDRIHESLVTYGRVVAYANHHKKMSVENNQATLEAIRKDIVGLGDHCTYLSGRVQFLLDATLGIISIEQNNIFKILSVASLIFMPPTLIAGIYGMNFKLIPELEWHWGYPMSIALMLVSGILPYLYLKRKNML